MNEQIFHSILSELIEENPFACRALLKILAIEFTDSVPTLAVTCSAQPRMLVNLEFVRKHCRNDYHVKAVICHEFLHVLLRHTSSSAPACTEEHLALDAVINAIIHRQLGEQYSSFMARYYASETGIFRLLRHWRDDEKPVNPILFIWRGLYNGKLIADDIRELAIDLRDGRRSKLPANSWLGNHDPNLAGVPSDENPEELSPVVVEALDRALKSMNGGGIWRAPHSGGIVADAYQSRVSAKDEAIERWRRSAWQVLRKHLLPDPRAPRTAFENRDFHLPVLSPGDRRSFARALWSPLLPDAAWQSPQRRCGASAQVYLDVSGSMNAEMPLIVTLLARLGAHIRRPFWAFSNVVAPAEIRNNQLHAQTTGGTSIACVLAHLAKTRPESAVIVTDGYIETVNPEQLRKCAGIRLHTIVTRDGSTAQLHKAGITYTQLGRLPA